jgi:predicted amidohydrolase YtcJ
VPIRPSLIGLSSVKIAITIAAAKTLSLEHKIGCIEAGKTANFTILKKNLFKVEPMTLKNIDVLGTVHRGIFYINKSVHLKPVASS